MGRPKLLLGRSVNDGPAISLQSGSCPFNWNIGEPSEPFTAISASAVFDSE